MSVQTALVEGRHEVSKVLTLRRNVIGLAVATTSLLVTPWLLLLAFRWMADEGVASTPLEVIALANRSQAIGCLFLMLLGMHAYLSDAGNGILIEELALDPTRRRLLVSRLSFGLLTSTALGTVTAGAGAAAWTVLGAGAAPGAQGESIWAYWTVTTVALVLGFAMHYVLGLLVGTVVRSRGLAVASGVGLIWVVLPMLTGALRMAVDGDRLLWLLPTESHAIAATWVPGGNSLMAAPAVPPGVALAVLGAWTAAGVLAWTVLVRRRAWFPADQG